MITLPQKLQDRISPEPNTGCWLWSGFVVPHGYGYFMREPAHRRVYRELRGEIPAGLDLDHLCRVRCCVNPDHLEPVTRSVNLLRGLGPQVQRERGRLRTHCKHGHEFTERTTIIKCGRRACRECARLRVNPGPRQRSSKYSPKGEEMRLTR